MYDNNGIDVIEPVELFLRDRIDPDRLSMYQEAIDTIKQLEKYTVLENVNSIIPNTPDESPSDIEGLIYDSFTRQLRELFLEYDIVVKGNNLVKLSKYLKLVNLIDSSDLSEVYVNIVESEELTPSQKLYQILSTMDTIDEEDFYQHFAIVSLNLLDRIRKIHQDKLDAAEDTETEVAEVIDLSLLRKVAKSNPNLLVNRLVKENQISTVLPVFTITRMVRENIDELSRDPDELSTELLAMFLVIGKSGKELIDIIRNALPGLLSDDLLLNKVSIILDRKYQELLG